jgi:hypothetical protein
MRRSPFLMLPLVAAGGLVAMASAAFADPSPVANAVIATSKATSYHLSMTNPRTGPSEGDFVSPDKVHMVSKRGESILIGSTMYLKINGKWTKVNAPGVSSSPVEVMKQMQAHGADYTSSDLGMRTVDGVAYHAYAVTNTKKHTTETVFVDAAGRLGRVETGGSTMTFSKYAEAISIQPPI